MRELRKYIRIYENTFLPKADHVYYHVFKSSTAMKANKNFENINNNDNRMQLHNLCGETTSKSKIIIKNEHC